MVALWRVLRATLIIKGLLGVLRLIHLLLLLHEAESMLHLFAAQVQAHILSLVLGEHLHHQQCLLDRDYLRHHPRLGHLFDLMLEAATQLHFRSLLVILRHPKCDSLACRIARSPFFDLSDSFGHSVDFNL